MGFVLGMILEGITVISLRSVFSHRHEEPDPFANPLLDLTNVFFFLP